MCASTVNHPLKDEEISCWLTRIELSELCNFSFTSGNVNGKIMIVFSWSIHWSNQQTVPPQTHSIGWDTVAVFGWTGCLNKHFDCTTKPRVYTFQGNQPKNGIFIWFTRFVSGTSSKTTHITFKCHALKDTSFFVIIIQALHSGQSSSHSPKQLLNQTERE